MRLLPLLTIPLMLALPYSHSQVASTARSARGYNLMPLFSHAWQLTSAPSKPAPGSMYIFLPNGTLLQTSCVETYRIAVWTIDKTSPSVLRVTEDNRLAFTANISDLSNNSLRLKQTLVRTKEIRNLAFKAVEGEFVCPDLPKK